jgi:hypothetical protein
LPKVACSVTEKAGETAEPSAIWLEFETADLLDDQLVELSVGNPVVGWAE